ncbi:hypothetical protein FE784_25890 [Paenibacillus hemerocallicola]|uniref:Fibronectin type-III domain-containing protein n=2 Tax=Paenibacillus hemerocallicola TaxID=1172614 RepID=A0A5C4T2R5_9BACL|nr:hypothetical protein FE784_25890 [Paenibacillus hemerocallicola]
MMNMNDKLIRLIVFPLMVALLTASLSTIREASPSSAQSREQQQSVTGTVYYVDSFDGNDANPGTNSDAPWKSLGKVNATTFSSGDRILFKAGGAWTGTLKPAGSGSAAAPITIDSYGVGSKPLIMGNGTRAAIELTMQEYWTIQNLEVTNDSAQAALRSGIYIHGTGSDPAAPPMRGIRILNMDVHHVKGIHNYLDGDVWRSAAIQASGVFENLEIDGNHVHDVTGGGIFHFSPGTSRDLVFRNNVVNKTGRDGIIVAQAKNVLVESNTVLDAGINGQGFRWIAGMFPTCVEDAIFQYNEVARTVKEITDGQGLDADVRNGGTIIFQYNYSRDNQGGFLLVTEELTPYRDSAPLQANIIRYNISQNDAGGEMKIRAPEKTYVYNNDIYCPDCILRIGSDGFTGYGEGAKLWNNIFAVAGGAYQPDFMYDSNLYTGIGVLPDDPNPVKADPLFISPGYGSDFKTGVDGYRLQAASPAINAGKPIADNGSRDYWGNPLYVGYPDIGAFEYPEAAAHGPAPDPGPVNMLLNPGFEAPVAGNWPWSYGYGDPASPFAYTTGQNHTAGGARSLMLTGKGGYRGVRQDIRVLPNTDYVFSLYANTNNSGISSKIAVFKVLDMQEATIGQAIIGHTGGDWQRFSLVVNSGSRTSLRLAVLDGGISGYFDDFSVVPADAVAPTWPNGSVLSATYGSSASVLLTWTPATDNTGVTQYRVYEANRMLSTVVGSVYNYTVNGLELGSDYAFTVKAGDKVGNWSEPGLTIGIRTP